MSAISAANRNASIDTLIERLGSAYQGQATVIERQDAIRALSRRPVEEQQKAVAELSRSLSSKQLKAFASELADAKTEFAKMQNARAGHGAARKEDRVVPQGASSPLQLRAAAPDVRLKAGPSSEVDLMDALQASQDGVAAALAELRAAEAAAGMKVDKQTERLRAAAEAENAAASARLTQAIGMGVPSVSTALAVIPKTSTAMVLASGGSGGGKPPGGAITLASPSPDDDDDLNLGPASSPGSAITVANAATGGGNKPSSPPPATAAAGGAGGGNKPPTTPPTTPAAAPVPPNGGPAGLLGAGVAKTKAQLADMAQDARETSRSERIMALINSDLSIDSILVLVMALFFEDSDDQLKKKLKKKAEALQDVEKLQREKDEIELEKAKEDANPAVATTADPIAREARLREIDRTLSTSRQSMAQVDMEIQEAMNKRSNTLNMLTKIVGELHELCEKVVRNIGR